MHPPRNLRESLIANCRPQPAIPAVLVYIVTLMGATSVAVPPGGAASGGGMAAWLIGAGIVVSCGLAIAAGFCSLAPPAAWLAFAWLGLRAISAAPGGLINRWLLAGCAAAAGAMIAVQLWRVRTGRFIPTISEETDPAAD